MKLPWNKTTESNLSQQLVYEIKSYPDGSKYVQIIQFGIYLTYRINNYEDLWILGQINDVLEHNNQQVILTIPNLIDAQADRRFNDVQPHSLKMVCKFLNSLKAFIRINIFHPHNQEVVETMIDNIKIIDNSQFIKEVLNDLFIDFKESEFYKNKGIEWNIENHLVLMSSDAGGFKPLMKLADKIRWQGETYSASKSRKYEDSKSKLIQLIDRDDFEGKDILIIDDLSIYGGTFKGLAKMLRERNCGRLYLAVSHMTVQDLGQDPVTDYFDKVFTTNSKFDNYNLLVNDGMGEPFKSVPKNLEIINLFL